MPPPPSASIVEFFNAIDGLPTFDGTISKKHLEDEFRSVNITQSSGDNFVKRLRDAFVTLTDRDRSVFKDINSRSYLLSRVSDKTCPESEPYQ